MKDNRPEPGFDKKQLQTLGEQVSNVNKIQNGVSDSGLP